MDNSNAIIKEGRPSWGTCLDKPTSFKKSCRYAYEKLADTNVLPQACRDLCPSLFVRYIYMYLQVNFVCLNER